MTVEAYLRAQVPGYPFDAGVIANAALSPIFAKPNPLKALSLQDEVEHFATNDDFLAALKYATSTLYYSAAGAFSGGSTSEQVGDIRSSQSGFIITQRDREYYRLMGNKLRGELGCEVEDVVETTSGMFDATSLRVRHGVYKI